MFEKLARAKRFGNFIFTVLFTHKFWHLELFRHHAVYNTFRASLATYAIAIAANAAMFPKCAVNCWQCEVGACQMSNFVCTCTQIHALSFYEDSILFTCGHLFVQSICKKKIIDDELALIKWLNNKFYWIGIFKPVDCNFPRDNPMRKRKKNHRRTIILLYNFFTVLKSIDSFFKHWINK